MAQYLLCMIQPDGAPPPPEVLGPIMARVSALRDEMVAAGVWVSSAGLHLASEAAVVRPAPVAGDAPLVTDGPYAETKEHLGGYTIVDVADRATALGWAAKIVDAAGLPIEVRQIQV